jgi:hypothetical protein
MGKWLNKRSDGSESAWSELISLFPAFWISGHKVQTIAQSPLLWFGKKRKADMLNVARYLCIAFVTLILPATVFANQTCPKGRPVVSVGGVNGFLSLSNPENTQQFRNLCGVDLYIHWFVWRSISPENKKSILEIFSNHNTDIEVNLPDNPSKWFEEEYRKTFSSANVVASTMHVNFFAPEKIELWKLFVSKAKSNGFNIVAPIFSPNGGQYKNASFSSAKWDFLRRGAKLGGGLTTDSPPYFFLSQPEAYRRFVVDEIRWAKSEGLYTTFIISPAKVSKGNFLEDTEKTIKFLEANDSVPDEYVVENYFADTTIQYPNMVGKETDTSSMAGVALHIAKSR